jgi:hypothetical protein
VQFVGIVLGEVLGDVHASTPRLNQRAIQKGSRLPKAGQPRSV